MLLRLVWLALLALVTLAGGMIAHRAYSLNRYLRSAVAMALALILVSVLIEVSPFEDTLMIDLFIGLTFAAAPIFNYGISGLKEFASGIFGF